MECPKCSTQMEEGIIDEGCWGSGEKPKLSGLVKFVGRETKWITAWRCPNCKKIELESE